MISLLRLIKIHPLLWAVLGIGGMAGLFKEILMLLFIILVHELGHACTANYYGWRIRKIELMPFGGMAEIEEYGNRPVKEEFFVTLNGPLQHLWMICASMYLSGTPIWSETDHQLFLFHNISILLFNLLPILPLDGGKLLFTLQSYFLSFQKSYHLTTILSLITLTIITFIAFIILPFHLNLVVIVCFLWLHQYLEWRQRHYHFLRFLLERQRLQLNNKEKKTIPVHPSITVSQAVKEICREKKVTFLLRTKKGEKYVNEKLVLQAFFDSQQKALPLALLK
ncbi:protease [Bacillus sp. A301a_S52]|nr:protease [Bacillus sp. A301a_S52]